jgi:hypothetical protein
LINCLQRDLVRPICKCLLWGTCIKSAIDANPIQHPSPFPHKTTPPPFLRTSLLIFTGSAFIFQVTHTACYLRAVSNLYPISHRLCILIIGFIRDSLRETGEDCCPISEECSTSPFVNFEKQWQYSAEARVGNAEIECLSRTIYADLMLDSKNSVRFSFQTVCLACCIIRAYINAGASGNLCTDHLLMLSLKCSVDIHVCWRIISEQLSFLSLWYKIKKKNTSIFILLLSW